MLRTLDGDRDGEGREGAETLEELRPEGLETDGDGRRLPGELCRRTLSIREELLGTKRGDGRPGRADGTEGEDSDTDPAARGVELREGVRRGLVSRVTARRLVDPALDLAGVVPGVRSAGAERPASGLAEERGLAGRTAWMSLRPRESTNRAISWRCWPKERRVTLGRERPVE